MCGVFVFSSVSAIRRLPPSPAASRPLTHTHPFTHPLTLIHSFTHSLSLTHSLIHSLTYSLTHIMAGVGQSALPRGPPRGSAGVPGSPPLLRGRRGTMYTAKGSDVRTGVPLASLGLRLFCVAGVGQGVGCAPRGFRSRPWVSAPFASQA